MPANNNIQTVSFLNVLCGPLRLTIASLLFSLFLVMPVSAAIEAIEFEDAETTLRYQAIIAELRCLVCQNQNLADSDAGLAKDLRRKAAKMIKSGASDDEVLEYMQERYGDFVLYRPPFNRATMVLWVGPFILLGFAACLLFFRIRRRQAQTVLKPISEHEQARSAKIRELMDNTPDLVERRDERNHKDSD